MTMLLSHPESAALWQEMRRFLLFNRHDEGGGGMMQTLSRNAHNPDGRADEKPRRVSGKAPTRKDNRAGNNIRFNQSNSYKHVRHSNCISGSVF